MSLIFYGHPLSSYCQKVLIALHELGAEFTFQQIDLSSDADRELMAGLTPMGKMPALHDDTAGVALAETSIIIEWLDRHHPGPAPLLPRDPDAALPVRQWDRFFDIHVMNAMQPMVDARLFMAKGAVDVAPSPAANLTAPTVPPTASLRAATGSRVISAWPIAPPPRHCSMRGSCIPSTPIRTCRPISSAC